MEIDRIHNPSFDRFYRDYVRKDRPVVITGLADRWPALASWNVEYLRSKTENAKVMVVVSKGQSTIDNLENGWQSHRMIDMPFHEFLERIENRAKLKRYHYIQYHKLDALKALNADFEVPREIIPSSEVNLRVWMGSGRNITPLHFDTQLNILAQVRGEKKVSLFPPSDTRYLYPFPAMSKNRTLSPVNLKNPDYAKHPKFRRASAFEYVLKPGEMIFHPVFWWHQVETLTDELTISLSFMWRPTLRSYFSRLGARAVIGILRDPPIAVD